MDIELLSRMVGELILTNDSVGLPGLGTFVAEEVPASFSDRGYTINPPYRRIVFRAGMPDDNRLTTLYAGSNGVDLPAAQAIIAKFTADLKETLIARKAVAMPGLGRLRATKENAFFFVADEDLDIFPDGCGLQPVSLKSREGHMPEDLLDFSKTLTVATEPQQASAAPEAEVAVEAASEPVTEEANPDVEMMVTPESAAEEIIVTPAAAEPEPTESVAQPAPVLEPTAQVAEAAAETAPTSPETPAAESSRGLKILFTILCIIIAALLLLGAFALLGRLAPDFVDKLLYSPEELEILHTDIGALMEH